MRVVVAGSGSQGNATLFEGGGSCLLVDAGLSYRAIQRRVESATGVLPRIDAILITHAHSDHVQHLGTLARRLDVPVYITAATRRAVDLPEGLDIRIFASRSRLEIGALTVETTPIPHDAAQVAVVVHDGGGDCVGLVTDLGHVPATLRRALAKCRTLLLESNHCPEMLQLAPYPHFVRARIASNHGHLANAQSAALLRQIVDARTCVLERVVLMHLSQKANSPRRAHRMAAQVLGGSAIELFLAKQDHPLVLDPPGRTQLALGF